MQSRDFVLVEPCDFDGEIFAVDGSNASDLQLVDGQSEPDPGRLCRLPGKRLAERTVITFDDVFLADPRMCREACSIPIWSRFFGLKGIDLKESDLDRLSSYYRELQEYVALNDAMGEAHAGDIILYDGSFDVFEPLRGVLATIFARAEEKGVALLAVAKSSSLFWGEEISLALCAAYQHGRQPAFAGAAWYLSLKDKKVDARPGQMGRRDLHRPLLRRSPSTPSGWMRPLISQAKSDRFWESWPPTPAPPSAWAILMPSSGRTGISGSPSRRGQHVRQKLMERLSEMGMSHSEIRMLMQDFHDILEMRPRI